MSTSSKQLKSPVMDEESSRIRLENVNNHFRRKAAEVVADESAVRLLARLYRSVTVDFSDLDTHSEGIALAKLTAAAFCEIGANSVYITESGQKFIDSIQSA